MDNFEAKVDAFKQTYGSKGYDRATGWDIFEHSDPHTTGYRFMMPGIGLTGRDLPTRRVDRRSVVTQEELGHHYIGEGDDDMECIMSLIKQRIEGHTCNDKCTVRGNDG